MRARSKRTNLFAADRRERKLARKEARQLGARNLIPEGDRF